MASLLVTETETALLGEFHAYIQSLPKDHSLSIIYEKVVALRQTKRFAMKKNLISKYSDRLAMQENALLKEFLNHIRILSVKDANHPLVVAFKKAAKFTPPVVEMIFLVDMLG